MGLFRRRPPADPGSSTDDPHQEITATDVLDWGLPTSCPSCDAIGYIDRIDLIDEILYQHCPSCWTRWMITKAEFDVLVTGGARPGE